MIVRRADSVELARHASRIAAALPAPVAMRRPTVTRVPIPPVHRVARVLVSDVVGWTAFEMGVVAGEIVGNSREARYFRARCAVAWIGFHAMKRSLNQVGAALGGRDHSTIFAARTRAEQLIEDDPAFRGMIDKLLLRLTGAAR